MEKGFMGLRSGRRGVRGLLEGLEPRVLMSTAAFWESKVVPVQLASHETEVDIRQIVIADLSGDGKNDIALAESRRSGWGNDYLGVLINRGDGTFLPVVHYALSGGTGGIEHGDFNGDGKEDLAVAGATQLQVFLNAGNGRFAPAVNYMVENGAGTSTRLSMGDFNVDGKLDLAVRLYDMHQTDIYAGNGDGTFAAPAHLVGVYADHAADMNGDGFVDLVGEDYLHLPAKFRVWLNDGSGGFGTHVDSTLGAASLIGDLNGDGRPDAVAVPFGRDILSVAMNNGDGTLGAAVDYWQPLLQGETLGDVNGDGKPDLVTASYWDKVNVRLNRGDGTFGAARNLFVPYPINYEIAAGDLNGDGLADVATQVSADEHFALGVMLNRNTGGTATAVTLAQSSVHTQLQEAVTFTARVWPEGGGVATGRVRFVVDGVTLAWAPVRNGVAQFQTSSLSETLWPPEKRFHTVTAVYDGDGRLAGSSSQAAKHAVSGPPRANYHLPTGGMGLMNGQVVTGWASDADTPVRSVEVQVVVDGRYVGSAVANEWRAGHPGHGFTFLMPTLGAGRHMVRVLAVDTRVRRAAELFGGQITV